MNADKALHTNPVSIIKPALNQESIPFPQNKYYFPPKIY